MLRHASSLPSPAWWPILLLPGTLALGPEALGAQVQPSPAEEPAPEHYWVSLGVGGSGGHYVGIGVSVSHAPAPGRVLSVRATYLEEFLPCIFGSCTPGDLFDAGILAGASADSRWTNFSVAAGLGIAATTKRGDESDPPDRSWSPAIPVEARALFTPVPYVGIGASGFGNVNFTQPMAGLFLTVQLGNLPGKRPGARAADR